MGSVQSYLTSENAATTIATILVAGAIGVGYTQVGQITGKSSSEEPPKFSKRKKQGSSSGGSQGMGLDKVDFSMSDVQLAALPDVIPGHFETKPVQAVQDSSAPEVLVPKSKNAKKKRAKGATDESRKSVLLPSNYTPESIVHPPPRPRNNKPTSQLPQASNNSVEESEQSYSEHLHTSGPVESTWTQVSSRRSRKATKTQNRADPSDSHPTYLQTDGPPISEHTEDEHDSFLLQQSALRSSSRSLPGRKPLAEKLLPPQRKTGVDDMLATSDYPSVSRVMRVTSLSEESAGFSLGDYEDVRLTTDGGENDADGEDDGWDVVTAKRPRRTNVSGSPSLPTSAPMKAPETLTKRQRQNAQNREKEKAAKIQAEVERLATLTKHKQGLEKLRMAEQFDKSRNKASGGMRAAVDQHGKLVWE